MYFFQTYLHLCLLFRQTGSLSDVSGSDQKLLLHQERRLHANKAPKFSQFPLQLATQLGRSTHRLFRLPSIKIHHPTWINVGFFKFVIIGRYLLLKISDRYCTKDCGDFFDKAHKIYGVFLNHCTKLHRRV